MTLYDDSHFNDVKRKNFYNPNDDEFFGDSPCQESIKISAFMCLYLYKMHEEIKFQLPFEPYIRENLGRIVLITMSETEKCFGELLEKMNVEDIDKYIHDLKVNIKKIDVSCRRKPDPDLPYVWISAFVLEATLFLSNHQRPKMFVQRSIEVLGGIFNGIRFLTRATIPGMCFLFQTKKPEGWMELMQNIRNRIQAPLLLTLQDFEEIVSRYP